MDELNKTSFIFLRHGEPVGGKKFRGSTDDVLTEKGWQQMQAAVKGLSYDEIISSPLKRCAEFSEKIQSQLGVPYQIHKDLQEIHLGEWEGLLPAQVEALDKKALYAFWDDPVKNTPPGAECFLDFEKRILTVWDKLKEGYISKQHSKEILVVSHAGVMMVLLKELLKIPIGNILTLKLNFASKVRIEVFDESYQLKPQIYIDHGYTF
ncbi:Alpha-ribazole-5'-phosphate phosphatase [hydrothermal vent metagenome]|uniref:Alpha-ribazole-5'-phosphate phosphatase n=1 Tax=hydrothermal vent metagenome TaxID=652676 RepID=A0A3B0ZJW6_9ZZZZ